MKVTEVPPFPNGSPPEVAVDEEIDALRARLNVARAAIERELECRTTGNKSSAAELRMALYLISDDPEYKRPENLVKSAGRVSKKGRRL